MIESEGVGGQHQVHWIRKKNRVEIGCSLRQSRPQKTRVASCEERAQNDNLFRPLIKLETQIKVSRFTCCSWRAATEPIHIGMKLIIIYTAERKTNEVILNPFTFFTLNWISNCVKRNGANELQRDAAVEMHKFSTGKF